MKVLMIFSIFVATAYISSCKSKSSSGAIKSDASTDTTSINTNRAHPKLISREESMQQIRTRLGLPDIKDSSTRNEIRIWINYASSDSGRIVTIRQDSNRWRSAAYYYEAAVDSSANITSIGQRNEANEPSSGWNTTMSRLKELGLYKLKSYKDISGYEYCTDGGGLVVEIVQNGVYQMYDYPCFEMNIDTLEEVKRVKQIGLFIEKNFGYRVFDQPKK